MSSDAPPAQGGDSHSAPSNGAATPTTRQPIDWRPVVYVLAGVAFLLLIASLTGSGTGLFGWGFMMASMWLWVLLVIAALVLLGYFLGQRAQPPGSG